MYSTCLHCHKSLGPNDAVEHFPVGRRLAFDSAKGRLWVVCQHCARWNLTPIEERWEAVEESERAFRAPRLRGQTDNIGLVRLTDSTAPSPTEFSHHAALVHGSQRRAQIEAPREMLAGRFPSENLCVLHVSAPRQAGAVYHFTPGGLIPSSSAAPVLAAAAGLRMWLIC